jgi:hypothetical protein
LIDWIEVPEQNYGANGDYQIFVAPQDGNYQIELRGAKGADTYRVPTFSGGNGAYTKGILHLSAGEEVYLYLGGAGVNNVGGYNGGGSITRQDVINSNYAVAGGGASDVRLMSGAWDNATSLNSRIMVAGG